eukprot:jgi/Tetstr1/453918/TSEL_040837.t1
MATILGECEIILERQSGASDQTAEVKRKAKDRIAVLSRLAKGTCELAAEGTEGDPLRAYTLVCHINALLDGVDALHRLLRQAVPETDGVVKPVAEVRKGAFRNLAHDVHTAIDYTLPVSWACVPAMRTIVQVLKDLQKISDA